MKRALFIALLVLFSIVGTVQAEEESGLWVIKSIEDFNTSNYHCLSAGLCSYSDEVESMEYACYGMFSMIGYKDLLKLDLGAVVPFYKFEDDHGLRITLAYGASTVFNDVIGDYDIELGVYGGFSASRHPYGVRIGLAW